MRIVLENKELEVSQGTKIRDLLLAQGINPETVVVKRGNEVAAEFEEARDGDRLSLIKVVSGG